MSDNAFTGLLSLSKLGVKRQLVESLLLRIMKVQGIQGIALAGSYATNRNTKESDIDFGVYYFDENPFNTQLLIPIFKELGFTKYRVFDFGEWGDWVNGGVWLETNNQKVDLIFRSFTKLEETIKNCYNGNIEMSFHRYSPLGFYNYVYLGELNICEAIYDPYNEIARLKRYVAIYPEKLRTNGLIYFKELIEGTSGWAETFALKGDKYNANAAIAKTIIFLNQYLYILNSEYFLNDKGTINQILDFPLHPSNYKKKIDSLLSHWRPCGLKKSVKSLRTLVEETYSLNL